MLQQLASSQIIQLAVQPPREGELDCISLIQVRQRPSSPAMAFAGSQLGVPGGFLWVPMESGRDVKPDYLVDAESVTISPLISRPLPQPTLWRREHFAIAGVLPWGASGFAPELLVAVQCRHPPESPSGLPDLYSSNSSRLRCVVAGGDGVAGYVSPPPFSELKEVERSRVVVQGVPFWAITEMASELTCAGETQSPRETRRELVDESAACDKRGYVR